ncbi:MAG: hypothetical protein UW54_C0028G0004 [Parcubacteria group bacterium GW2011_GWC1_44_26]|nr:MAG: hypothetical protein UW54_C0028G0004 [Parcubacteria group bacterium GW2011_GWC1_44_26]
MSEKQKISPELQPLRKSGLSVGFKASLYTLIALHFLIFLSSGFFQKIFLEGEQFILVIQTTFLFIFVSIISNEFSKWQLSKLPEQHSIEIYYVAFWSSCDGETATVFWLHWTRTFCIYSILFRCDIFGYKKRIQKINRRSRSEKITEKRLNLFSVALWKAYSNICAQSKSSSISKKITCIIS